LGGGLRRAVRKAVDAGKARDPVVLLWCLPPPMAPGRRPLGGKGVSRGIHSVLRRSSERATLQRSFGRQRLTTDPDAFFRKTNAPKSIRPDPSPGPEILRSPPVGFGHEQDQAGRVPIRRLLPQSPPGSSSNVTIVGVSSAIRAVWAGRPRLTTSPKWRWGGSLYDPDNCRRSAPLVTGAGRT
jgi:hypothetical protein